MVSYNEHVSKRALTLFLQALSKPECKGKGACCKYVWSLDVDSACLRSWISSYATDVMWAACSLMTDNDSDDDVNGGSPKLPPNRQHRKEKKEFPVSMKIFHNIYICNMHQSCDRHCKFQWVFGRECHLWCKSQYIMCGVSPISWPTLPLNLKYVVFLLSDPNSNS